MKFLDSDRNEGRSLEEIATDIVDGYHEALTAPLKKPATPLRHGMLFKGPHDTRVRRVAWLDPDAGVAWIVSETSSYGWIGALGSDVWQYWEEYRPRRRVEVDGKGKMVEMTDEEIDEAWENPDWKVGDKLSQHQRKYQFLVVATAPQCVLMYNSYGDLTSDSNKNLEKYYQRETETAQW